MSSARGALRELACEIGRQAEAAHQRATTVRNYKMLLLTNQGLQGARKLPRDVFICRPAGQFMSSFLLEKRFCLER